MNIDEQLRRYDPARDVPQDLGRSPRAMAALTRVTATPPGTGSPAAANRPAHRRRGVRYALATVVAAAGAVVAPILSTGNAAFADWDATPRPVTEQQSAHYAQECATWTKISIGSSPGGYEPKVIEMRGPWVMTYLASADGEAQCLRSLEPSPDFVDGENETASGPLPQTPAADALVTAGVLETSDAVVSSRQFIVAGKVGSKVTGVIFQTQGRQVRATVENGSFAAWWPKQKPASIFGRLIDAAGYNGSPNPEVKITLNDGRTITKHIKDYDVNH